MSTQTPKRKSKFGSSLRLSAAVILALATACTAACVKKPENVVTAVPGQPSNESEKRAEARPDLPRSQDGRPKNQSTQGKANSARFSPAARKPGSSPSLPNDLGTTVVNAETALSYRWNVGDEYYCHFEFRADYNGVTRVSSGYVVYRPTDADPATIEGDKEESRRDKYGTGTAFVVHPDGLLVTCAHVVVGASEVQVHLGGKRFAGQVVALDKQKDLALVRVKQKGLPWIALGDSNKVQLAQEIRVIGFPLSDVLGESIKVSRGEVSGVIDQKQGGKLLQIDATVNPGNSGGPIVDQHGRVIGVASALMTGERISAIGFGIPSSDVQALIKRSRVQLPAADTKTAPLSGPEVVRRVSPAVALLKVRYGPGGVGEEQQKVVHFQGLLSTRLTSVGRLPGLSGRGSSNRRTDRGKVVVNAFGEMAHHDGSVELPLLQGRLGEVGIELLPSDGSQRWSQRRLFIIQEVKKETRQVSGIPGLDYRPPRLGRRFGRRQGYYPFGRRTETTEKTILHPAIEQIAYEITKTDGDTVEIKKTFELKTVGKDKNATPYMLMSGAGTFTFDTRRGIPRKGVFAAKFSIRVGSRVVTVPFTLKYRFKTPEEMAEARTEREGAKKRAAELAAKASKEREERGGVRKINEPGKAAAIPPAGTGGGLSKFNPDSPSEKSPVKPSPKKGVPKKAVKPPAKPQASGGGLNQFNPGE